MCVTLQKKKRRNDRVFQRCVLEKMKRFAAVLLISFPSQIIMIRRERLNYRNFRTS